MPITRPSLFACLIGAVVVAAPQSAMSMPNDTDQPAKGGRFYQKSGQPAVMFQYTDALWCHVQTPRQMNAYGGFKLVIKVPILKMVGRQTGDCGWPNGFYRRNNEPAVYRLSGASVVPNVGLDICHVINPKQMALFGGFGKVVVVEPVADIGRGRRTMTECRNP